MNQPQGTSNNNNSINSNNNATNLSGANPQLVSLLQKLVHPLEKVQVRLQVGGVFSFHQEWLTTDELNANMFTYQVKFGGMEILEGKTCKRQKTEQEIKQEEEEKAAKTKKAPPPPKKDDKNKLPEPVISPEEEEAIRLQKQKDEQEARRQEEEWNSLDEETKFHRTFEDQHQKPAIRWDPAQNTITVDKEGQDIVIFQERIFDDKGDWLYFIRKPTITDDEIAKLKKGKPKNLNPAELTSIVFRTWVNLDEFSVPGTEEIVQRCRLEQYITPEMPTDIPKISLDHLKTYVLIKLKTTPAVQPLVKEIQPQVSDLVPKPPPIPKLPPAQECINEFRQELILAMESLAMEYSSMFAKEQNAGQDQKIQNVLTVQQKQEMQQHKETFLYDFNVSGKYKVLKERMKKSIVKICRDKFQQNGSVTGITTDQKDQFYSEIYIFLMEQMRTTLGDLISLKRNQLHQDIVTSYEQSEKERDKTLQIVTKESKVDKLIRLSTEYEAVNQMDLAEQNLKNLVATNSTDPQAYYTYARFLLRQKLFSKAEELLVQALSYDPDNREYQLLQASILIKRSRFKEAAVFLLNLTNVDPLNQLYNNILSFLYGQYLNDARLGEKYKKIAERIFMRNNGLINAQAAHQNNPNPAELPSFQPLSHAEIEANKGPQLSAEQIDIINMEMIQYFATYNIFDLAVRGFESLNDQNTLKANLVKCQILYFQGNTNDCVTEINKILESNAEKDKSKTYDILTMKANICFLTDKLFECEETYLKALQLKGGQNPTIFLRLGYVYLKRKSWGDAKAIFSKAVQLKMNSSLSWLGLGISCLRLGDFQQGQEALSQANIYDQFNGETWGYLALLCLMDRGRYSQANQCLREMLQTDMADLVLLEEIGDELTQIGQYQTAEQIYIKIFDIESDRQFDNPNYGELNQQLGEVYTYLRRHHQAAICYEEAMNYLVGENDRLAAKTCAEQAQYHANNPEFV